MKLCLMPKFDALPFSRFSGNFPNGTLLSTIILNLYSEEHLDRVNFKYRDIKLHDYINLLFLSITCRCYVDLCGYYLLLINIQILF